MIGPKSTKVLFNAGDVLFRNGDARTALYVIKSGRVEISKTDASGARLPLGIVGQGEFLGETGLLDDHPYHGTWAIALSDVEAIRIPHESIAEQLEKAPQWLVSMAKGLADKLRRTNELIQRNGVADAKLIDVADQAEEKARQDRETKRKRSGK